MTAPPVPRSCSVSVVQLAAVLPAVGVSRAFVRQTLRHWRLPSQVDAAELVLNGLMTDAVKCTGLTAPGTRWSDLAAHHVIGVQLRAVDAGLYVEVWDGGSGSPRLQEPAPEAECGRGLFLLDAASRRWGVDRAVDGGKVVRARLPLAEPPDSACLSPDLPPYGIGGAEHACRTGRLNDPEAFFGRDAVDAMDAALTRRAVDGLRDLRRRAGRPRPGVQDLPK